VGNEDDPLSRYHKRRCKLLRILQAYRDGVYQTGMSVRNQHIDTTPNTIANLERRLAKLERLIEGLACAGRAVRN
jgi:hypothetical protein